MRRHKSADVFSQLSFNAKVSLRLAHSISIQLFSKEVGVTHLFLGCIFNTQSLASKTFTTIDINSESIKKLLVGEVNIALKGDTKEREIVFDEQSKEVLKDAYTIAKKLSHVYVGSEHIVMAILKNTQFEVTKKLKRVGITYDSFELALLNFATYPLGILSKPEMQRSGFNIGDQSLLELYGDDLVKLAKEGELDPIVGREDEVEKIVNVLSRRKKNNPLIIGEAGVGKTAIVEALAQRIADGNVPQSLQGAKIVALDISSIAAGSKMRGDIEEKMMAIVKEVVSAPNTILFIDEIHNILSGSIPGMPSDYITVLKPALTGGRFRCIGATTTAEYTKYLEEDNALVRRFQPITVLETTVLDTVRILKRIKPILESHHGVKISKEAIESAVVLSDRYVNDRYLPDKAIDLLDEASATMRLSVEREYSSITDLMNELRVQTNLKDEAVSKGDLVKAQEYREKEISIQKDTAKLEKEREKNRKGKDFEVGSDVIKNVVSKWTGIPISTLDGDQKSSLFNLDRVISKKVVGQSEAVNAVANAIKRARTGISSGDRPWASFLFLGPTGVGKTELAKVLTEDLFGDRDRLIQIDMSELAEMHSVSKLIGSPPGYIGYKEGGQLTEKVRNQPHSVILFDEIEKAHPDVLNVLLQILEYGHLTDGKGRKVNFKNTVIILTSNIGAEEIRKDKILGFTRKDSPSPIDNERAESAYESMKNTLMKKLKDTIRPELLNRLDDIVIFRSLSKEDAALIVDLLIDELNHRMKKLSIKLQISKALRKYLVKEGFSDEYGARPLRRLLQSSVENILADYILKNDFESNKEQVRISLDYIKEKIVIK